MQLLPLPIFCVPWEGFGFGTWVPGYLPLTVGMLKKDKRRNTYLEASHTYEPRRLQSLAVLTEALEFVLAHGRLFPNTWHMVLFLGRLSTKKALSNVPLVVDSVLVNAPLLTFN